MFRMLPIAFLVTCASTVLADINVGSDGSDGVFNPSGNVTVDLGLAIPGDALTTPGSGNGVYDAARWVVCFKYTSVNIASGRTVTFTNHPSRAPVVWLVQSTVTIGGTISLDGAVGNSVFSPIAYSEPGPGGFRGGRRGANTSLESGGLGPGGANRGATGSGGTGGSFASMGGLGPSGGAVPSPVYGNAAILPVIGGSGGSGTSVGGGGGGAGGGAILIAANSSIVVSGFITANGGGASGGGVGANGGCGSGGAIRLVSDSISGNGVIRALGGSGNGAIGGLGRIRIDANSNQLTSVGEPPWASGAPIFVFAPLGVPKLRAAQITDGAGSHQVPVDPRANVLHVPSADVSIDSCEPVPVTIEAQNVPVPPAATTVDVRVVAASGPTNVFPASFVSGDQTLSTWTANVTFVPGTSAVQVRATFPPVTLASLESKRVPRGLRTLTGERIVRVEYGGTTGGAGRAIYVTEKGQRIPVDVR